MKLLFSIFALIFITGYEVAMADDINPGNKSFNQSQSFVGDSIAYGMALFSNVENKGIVGAGITTGKPDRNEKYWTSGNAKTVIVEIGTNDFRYKGDNYSEKLTKYILPLKKEGVVNLCIMETPTPAMKRPDIREGVLKLKPQIESWTKKNNLTYIHFPEFTPKDRAKDGLHFTASAYKAFAKEALEQCH